MDVIHEGGYGNAKSRMEAIVRLKPGGKIVEFTEIVLNLDVFLGFSCDQQRRFI